MGFPKVYRKLEDDLSVKRMLSRRELAEGTKLQYLAAIKDFSDFIGLKPFETINYMLGLEDATEKIVDWIVDAKKRLAPKTCRNWLNGIRIWLKENKVKNIDWDEVRESFRSYVGKVRTLVNRDYIEREQIIKLLQVSKLRERALICFAASSGLRVCNTVIKLKLKHVKDDLWNEDLPCYMIEVPGEYTKENIPHITFISAEAAKYLRTYLKQRMQKGEKITSESLLFVRFDGKPISASTIRNIWAEICRKAGIDRKIVKIKGKRMFGNKLGKSGHLYNIRVHSLRKYFKTSCSVMGVDRMASEAFMGHSLSTFGIEDVYDYCTANKEYLRTQYEVVLPLLTFLEEPPSVKTVINSKARRMIEELEEKLQQQAQDIEFLRKSLFGLLKLEEEALQKIFGKGVRTWTEAMETKKWKKLVGKKG